MVPRKSSKSGRLAEIEGPRQPWRRTRRLKGAPPSVAIIGSRPSPKKSQQLSWSSPRADQWMVARPALRTCATGVTRRPPLNSGPYFASAARRALREPGPPSVHQRVGALGTVAGDDLDDMEAVLDR